MGLASLIPSVWQHETMGEIRCQGVYLWEQGVGGEGKHLGEWKLVAVSVSNIQGYSKHKFIVGMVPGTC